jgi:hypothetical protein
VGEEGGKTKVHWVAREKLLAPKSKGGMGFRDMRKFNQALLARQTWQLIQYPESLCALLIRDKYYHNGELVDTVFPGNASPTWKSIEYGLDLLKHGIVWRLGSGSKIQIWHGPWLPRAPSRKISAKRGRMRLCWVSQLMVPGRREWDVQLLESVLLPHDIQEVLKVRLSVRAPEDHVTWFYEKSIFFQ